mgnify:CR=1 FL=1
MKKVLAAVGISALLLVGCAPSGTHGRSNLVDDNTVLPSGYAVMSSDKIDSMTTIFEVMHKKTKKRYTVVKYEGSGITMYELDGEEAK